MIAILNAYVWDYILLFLESQIVLIVHFEEIKLPITFCQLQYHQ